MTIRKAARLGVGLVALGGATAGADDMPRVPILPASAPALRAPDGPPPTPAPLAIKPASAVVSRVVASSAGEMSSAMAFPQALADAKTAYARLRDYAGHYVRQERVAGRVVPEETCELRVRTKPFAASLKVVAPKELAGRETVFSSAKGGNRVQFKESGRVNYATLPIDAPAVLADSRHPLTDVGLAAVIDRVELAMLVERRLNNPVQVIGTEYVFAGKPCQRWELFMDRAHPRRYAARHVLYLDLETKLPVRYEAHDAPKPGGPAGGEVVEVQSFVGLKFNVGLGEAAFER